MSVAPVAGLRSPYKGLAPFEDSEQDALFFFGRERECEVAVANIVASKLTVLYGPSGVGKSSMLRAAVTRRLREVAPEADVMVLSEWAGDPVLPQPRGEAFLILDQFEEYFLYHGEGRLLDDLPELLERPRVHVLISLRDDALSRLDAFQARIPSVFANRLSIDHLDRAAARAAIVGPIDRWNELVPEAERAGIEGALVAAVLDEVASAPGGNGSSGSSRIEAPYLQLVMERVWEEERAQGSSLLRAETLERLGGAREIVSAHLERTLGTLTPHDAAIAASALVYLVTPSRTKIAQSFDDLVGYTDEPSDELRDVLELLAAQRILRVSAVDGGSDGRRYEIFHDVLAEPVLTWRRGFAAEAALEAERAASAKRHRRLTVIAVGAGLVAAAMIALAAYAVSQKNEASQAAHRARVAAAAATVSAKNAKKAEKNAQQQTQNAQQQTKKANEATQTAKQETKTANEQTQKANDATQTAQQQTQKAQHAEAVAKVQKNKANAATARAKVQAQHARARALAERARATAATNPVGSVALALEAYAREPGASTEDVLRNSVVADRVRAVMRGGGGKVETAVFSPNGSHLVSLADRGGARLFDANGTLVRRLGSGHPSAVAFSPDSSVAATAGSDGVQLWNATTGAPARTLSSARTMTLQNADTVVFSANGKRIAAGGAGAAVVWSADGTQLASFPHDGVVTSVELDADGTRLVTVATDSSGRQQARVFDVGSGSLAFLIPERGITSAVFSPDGTWVATTSNDKTERLWDATSGAQHSSRTADGHLLDAQFSSDGKTLLAANDAGGALVTNVPGLDIQSQLLGPTNRVVGASFSPDGQYAVVASLDGTARVYRADDGFQLAVLTAGSTGGVLDANWGGRRVVTAAEDGRVRIFDPGVNPLLGLVGKHAGAVTSVHVSPNGKLALSSSADKTARLWSLRGGGSVVLQHDGPVEDATFSHDGSLVLTGSDDGTAKLWRAPGGGLVRTLPVGSGVRAVDFAPDDRTVATAEADGTAAIWRVSDGARLHVLPATAGKPVDAVRFSWDGTLVATAGDDGVARIWDAKSGKLLHRLTGHTDAVTSVAFSRDDTRIVTASKDDTARLWDVASGTLIRTLAGHTGAVNDAEFSPDGSLIVTASADDDLRLWNGRTGRSGHILRGHFGSVSTGAFSPNGKWIVSGGPTTVGIWTVKTGTFFLPTNSNDPYLRGPTLAVSSVVFAPNGRTVVAGSLDGSVRDYDCLACAGAAGLVAQGKAELRAATPRG